MASYRFIRFTAVGLLALAGCASTPELPPDDKIVVTATDDACEISEYELLAGTHTFAVTNQGEQVTEFYLYSGEKVVSEVENIAPGTTRDLTVDLTEGEYEGACKPGMKGDGIRTRLIVFAAPDGDPAEGSSAPDGDAAEGSTVPDGGPAEGSSASPAAGDDRD